MRKHKAAAIGCRIVVAICFGIVSYGHFYRGRTALGGVFALLAIAQPVRARVPIMGGEKP